MLHLTQFMRRVTKRQLAEWALCDALTGLASRRACEEMARLQPAHYVVIDLDGFKHAQDRKGRGHAWGDRVLREFGRWLARRTREQDVLAGRPGGDEFVVITPTREAAEAIAERVRGWSDRSGEVSASAGVGPTWEAADRAMYVQKGARKSQKRA